MARLEWIEERLQNWARWKLMRGGGELGYAAVDLLNPNAGRDGYVQSAIPTSEVEAAETDGAISRLNPRGLALSVHEFYVGHGGIADKAGRLHCGVSTLHRRIDDAHRQLAEHFLAQQDRAKAERARVEALKAGANSRGFYC
jgi:hypothetical protein